MSGIPVSSEILGAMITPAVLISPSGVLVLSTSNRVSRTVDRVRSLSAKPSAYQSLPRTTRLLRPSVSWSWISYRNYPSARFFFAPR